MIITEYEALDTLLSKENWEEELENLHITIKWSEDKRFFLLKYNQLFSDFNNPVVRACRGIIYTTDTYPFQCVCAPFIKFGNYGEGYCPNLDWTTARVLEKIDGSLMKAWYYQGDWHLSTNGTIDAYDAEITSYLSFGQHFDNILGEPFKTWAKHTLNPNFTYMFELTSLINRVVIEYPQPQIWFLSRRNMTTMQEDSVNDTGLNRPHQFDMTNLQDCLKVTMQMSKDQEGVVVNDKNFNRIKIKSPEYLMAAHLVNNHQITTRRIIQMIQDLSVDDFLAYCSEYTEQVGKIQAAIITIAKRLNNEWLEVEELAQGANIQEDGNYNRLLRKQFAQKAITYKDSKDFLFWKCDRIKLSAEDYLLNLRTSKLKQLVEKELNN